MTVKKLDDAILEIQELLATLSGLGDAPVYPPEQAARFPFLIVVPNTGEYIKEASGRKRAEHTITAQIHINRKDMTRDTTKAIPYAENAVDKLLADSNNTLSGSVDQVLSVSYRFGAMEYGGVATVGYSFDIRVKIRNTA